MATDFSGVRQFEDEYCGEMPDNVRRAVTFRNEGEDHFRSGDGRGARRSLEKSLGLLGGFTGSTFTSSSLDRVDFDPADPGYGRESFATLSRLAQVRCASPGPNRYTVGSGGILGAVGYAMAAVRIQETMLGILRVASVPGFDQYLPIFEARISAILTSHSRLSPIISRPAKGAWGRVRNSENPEKAVFASREMTPEQRVTARRKHQVALLAATAARALPLDVRRKVAVEICSR